MSRDHWIDLDTLPEEIVAPIKGWVEKLQNTPRFERHVGLGFVNFTIRIPPPGPRIRQSELTAIFRRYADAATASARVHRQQTAELQAKEALVLAEGHKRFLASLTAEDFGLLAARLAAQAEADARVARGYNGLLAEKTALASKVEKLSAENATLRTQMAGLKKLYKPDAGLAAKWAAEKASLAGRVDKLAEEKGALHSEIARLTACIREYAQTQDEIAAAAAKVINDRDALRHQIDQLVADKQRLFDERAVLLRQLQDGAAHEVETIAAAEKLFSDYATGSEKHQATLKAERDALKRERALLVTQVHNLTAANRRRVADASRWEAQVRAEGQAAVQLKREGDALRAQVAALEDAKKQLEGINAWLHRKLRFRSRDPRAA